MHLYVIRHGEAEHNVAGIINTNPNNPSDLTEKGEQQAMAVAKQLEEVPLDVIYVSEFDRAQQTANIINQRRKLPIIVDARLNELNIGFEGQTHQQWRAARKASEDEWTFRVAGAESLADGHQRTQAFIDDLAQKSYLHVAIITHGFSVMAIRAIAEGFSLKQDYATHHDPGLNVLQGEVIELSLS